MQVIAVQGWNTGFQKVRFTELLRSSLGYSLSGAKAVTDAVLEQKPIELQVPESEFEQLLPRLLEAGAKAALKGTR